MEVVQHFEGFIKIFGNRKILNYHIIAFRIHVLQLIDYVIFSFFFI